MGTETGRDLGEDVDAEVSNWNANKLVWKGVKKRVGKIWKKVASKCEDKIKPEACKQKLDVGECHKKGFKGIVRSQCRKTCGLCKSGKKRADKTPFCKTLASKFCSHFRVKKLCPT